MDNIDDIFMADYKESMGLGTRFQFAEDMPVVEQDPLDVSMEGITVPERSVGEYGAGLGETWLNMLRGMGAATVGAGGDIEAILTGIKDAIMAEGDESAWEAFQQGMGKETVLPSTEDVVQVLPEVPSMSAMTPEEMEMAQGMGEFGGIPGAVAGTAKVAKSISRQLKPAKIMGLKMTPDALAENATKLLADNTSRSTLKKYVEILANRRTVKAGDLCHDKACKFIMKEGSQPGDKLLMLKTSGQPDFVAHSIVVDKSGNLKYDNFGGQWDQKTKTYMAPEVDDTGKPIPQAFRKFSSYEEVDIDLLKKAAEKYKGIK